VVAVRGQERRWRYFLCIFIFPGFFFIYLSLYSICPYIEWTECEYPRMLCEYPGFCNEKLFSDEILKTEFRYIIRSRGFGFSSGDLFFGEDPLFYVPYAITAPANNREKIARGKIDITDSFPNIFYKGPTVMMLTNDKERAIEFFDSNIFGSETSYIWIFFKRDWRKK
jgi:hypothetical protein